MQGNIIGQSGSLGSGLNVYAQLREPSKKDGVWIKTEETAHEPLFQSLPNIPYNFYNGVTAVVEDEVYLFGQDNNVIFAYKFSTITNTYVSISAPPTTVINGKAVAIGTNIYIFGGSTNKRYVYKYDTLANTYTRLADIPYDFVNGNAVAIGTSIYLFGGNGSVSNYAYKYDTLTNKYTKLANRPCGTFKANPVEAISTNIYLFSSSISVNKKYVHMYNTITDTYTELKDSPYNFYNSKSIALNEYIYFFGAYSSTQNYSTVVMLYNTATDTYTELNNIPINFTNSEIQRVENNAYVFGITASSQCKTAYKAQLPILPEVQKYKYDKVELVYDIDTINKNNKTIFIETKQLFKVLLTKALSTYISNAYISTDTELLEYPVYYGDGENWNKI